MKWLRLWFSTHRELRLRIQQLEHENRLQADEIAYLTRKADVGFDCADSLKWILRGDGVAAKTFIDTVSARKGIAGL